MRRVIAWAVLLSASMACAQNVAGDWQGTLKAGTAEFRLVLHIAKNTDGTFKATLDSVDQGTSGIPVTSVSLKDSKLDLVIDAVHGTYDGKVNGDATEISGTWTQGQALPLDFKRAAAPVKTERKAAKPSDIDGEWQGVLDTGGSKLHVVFHITNMEDGLLATLDSPDQGSAGIPVSSVSRTGASLKMEVKGVGGQFDGKISSDLGTIDGTWTQMGNAMPLTLKRVK